jgi:hypothetical protein
MLLGSQLKNLTEQYGWEMRTLKRETGSENNAEFKLEIMI